MLAKRLLELSDYSKAEIADLMQVDEAALDQLLAS
jgi:hypothetical protein